MTAARLQTQRTTSRHEGRLGTGIKTKGPSAESVPIGCNFCYVLMARTESCGHLCTSPWQREGGCVSGLGQPVNTLHHGSCYSGHPSQRAAVHRFHPGSSEKLFSLLMSKNSLIGNQDNPVLFLPQTCCVTSGQLLLVSGSCWSNHEIALCCNGLGFPVPPPSQSL